MNYLMTVRFTQENPVSKTHYESGSHFLEVKVAPSMLHYMTESLTALLGMGDDMKMSGVLEIIPGLRTFLNRIDPIVAGTPYDLMLQLREWDEDGELPLYGEPRYKPLVTLCLLDVDCDRINRMAFEPAALVKDATKHDAIPGVQPSVSVPDSEPT